MFYRPFEWEEEFLPFNYGMQSKVSFTCELPRGLEEKMVFESGSLLEMYANSLWKSVEFCMHELKGKWNFHEPRLIYMPERIVIHLEMMKKEKE